MRIIAVALVLALSTRAHAQIGGTNLWGGTPRNITFTPIDTTKAIGSSDLSKAFKTNTRANSPLNLSGMFPSLTMPTWPPKEAHVTALPQKQNPFQPNGIKGGINPFNPPAKKK